MSPISSEDNSIYLNILSMHYVYQIIIFMTDMENFFYLTSGGYPGNNMKIKIIEG